MKESTKDLMTIFVGLLLGAALFTALFPSAVFGQAQRPGCEKLADPLGISVADEFERSVCFPYQPALAEEEYFANWLQYPNCPTFWREEDGSC